LVLDDAFKTTKGGPPSATALAAARDSYLSSRTETADQLQTQLLGAGFTDRFVDPYLDANAKFGLLAAALGDADGSKTIAYLGKIATIDVNPRFGGWDASQFQLTSAPALPSFLKLVTVQSSDATA